MGANFPDRFSRPKETRYFSGDKYDTRIKLEMRKLSDRGLCADIIVQSGDEENTDSTMDYLLDAIREARARPAA